MKTKDKKRFYRIETGGVPDTVQYHAPGSTRKEREQYVAGRENVHPEDVSEIVSERPGKKSRLQKIGARVRPHYMDREDNPKPKQKAKTPAKKKLAKNPEIHIDVNSHNTRGKNVRAKNPDRPGFFILTYSGQGVPPGWLRAYISSVEPVRLTDKIGNALQFPVSEKSKVIGQLREKLKHYAGALSVESAPK